MTTIYIWLPVCQTVEHPRVYYA